MSVSRWFTTACFVDQKMVAGELREWPGSTAHAKEMGTLRTACGQNAASWHKLWELPFEAAGPIACPACATVVADSMRVTATSRAR